MGETKSPISLNIVMLIETDLQNAYLVASQLAKEESVHFNGIFPWNLQTNPPSFVQSLYFTLDATQINEITSELTAKLAIPKQAVRLAINPARQTSEKPMPEGIIR